MAQSNNALTTLASREPPHANLHDLSRKLDSSDLSSTTEAGASARLAHRPRVLDPVPDGRIGARNVGEDEGSSTSCYSQTTGDNALHTQGSDPKFVTTGSFAQRIVDENASSDDEWLYLDI